MARGGYEKVCLSCPQRSFNKHGDVMGSSFFTALSFLFMWTAELLCAAETFLPGPHKADIPPPPPLPPLSRITSTSSPAIYATTCNMQPTCFTLTISLKTCWLRSAVHVQFFGLYLLWCLIKVSHADSHLFPASRSSSMKFYVLF